jgi:hypothetical protein
VILKSSPAQSMRGSARCYSAAGPL